MQFLVGMMREISGHAQVIHRVTRGRCLVSDDSRGRMTAPDNYHRHKDEREGFHRDDYPTLLRGSQCRV